MKDVVGHIWDVIQTGRYFGDNARPNTIATVEPAWFLTESTGSVGSHPSSKLPIRHFLSTDAPPTEVEIPNLKTLHTYRSLDQDAATFELTIYNHSMLPEPESGALGNPGYYTWSRGASFNPWNHESNSWEDILIPNALIRTYQGYGGWSKSLEDAVADGNVVQTGTWLVDEVRIYTDGTIQLRGRDMTKLLIEQDVYVPLIPSAVYPLHYSRFSSWVVDTPAIAYGSPAGNAKKIVAGTAGAIFMDATGQQDLGYWLLGDDGGVFSYGSSYFHGSNAGYSPAHSIVGIAANRLRSGYWVLRNDGQVFTYGNAALYGSSTVRPTPYVGITSPTDVDGYYLVTSNGEVYAYGAAQFHGGQPVTPKPIVDIACAPDGTGYWMVNSDGQVYAYGSVSYFGNTPDDTGSDAVAIAATPSGLGYWIVDAAGHVYAFGDADFRGGADSFGLEDPITDFVPAPNGTGYWLIAADGGVFAFGPNFYGSLLGGTEFTFPIDGNYHDFADIVKDLLLWSGFWLHPNTEDDGDGTATVYGNIESTGTAATDLIPEDLFDKRPVMDSITKLKEAVGYIFWIDEEGAPHFGLPNWWGPGNFLPDGSHTITIPTIDERYDLINYGANFSDKTARSSIVISSEQPTLQLDGTVTTVIVPPSNDLLRGMKKSAMWVNPLFTSADDQRVMAELIGLQMWFSQRLGAVDCVANPMIQLDDQIKIREEQSEEFYIHYVRTIDTTHDLDSGSYRMSLTTHWLGVANNWLIERPA